MFESMTHLSKITGIAVVALVGLEFATGHIYMLEPCSRQVYKSPVHQLWPYENVEHCPHCYNARGPKYVRPRAEKLTDPEILAEYGNGEWPLLAAYEKGEVAENGNYIEREELSVRHGVCGDPEQRESEGSNVYSTANKDWPILTTFPQNGVIKMEIVMSAYHWGHLEFFLCNSEDLSDPDGVPTQGCFNMNPLTRTAGDGVNSPIDPSYPGRYYVDPECREKETVQDKPEEAAEGYVMHMTYDLPRGLICKRCILQMVYYTGNACKHVGYEEFDPASWPSACAPEKRDWIDLGLKTCGEDGAYPEEFWNCADIAITADGEANPTPSPTEPAPDCPDPVEAYEQCGGGDWTGSECCREGFECTEMGPCYSQCRPIEGGCSDKWEQCGGTTKTGWWEGPECCWPGSTCTFKTRHWSSCVPDDWEPEE